MKFFIGIVSLMAACLLHEGSFAQETTSYPGFYDPVNKNNIDSTSKLKVEAIEVSGNKKTKTYIILREMQFKAGDSIIAAQLLQLLEQSRALVYNTSLFSDVQVTPQWNTNGALTVKVHVLEKIYILPMPQFKLVDRNLNEWVKTYHANLNRVVYGIKFAHYNLSGRGDKLRIYLLNGYARSIAFSYTAPYSNGQLTEGFSLQGSYTQIREIPYKTSFENKQLQFKKNDFVKNHFVIGATYQRRRGYFNTHLYTVTYNYIKVNDSIISPVYNPHYINSGKSFIGYPDIRYSYLYSNTNNINYPLTGKIRSFSILKRGLEWKGKLNMLSIDALAYYFKEHTHHWYSSFEIKANVKLPFQQAYYNQDELGYKDFNLRGLEYYVIDGVAAGVAKYTLKKKLVAFSIPFPFGIKKIPRLPFAIYAKSYADVGYSFSQKEFDTQLGNKLLYTAGLGIDIISLYDTTLRIEYSFNQLGENGLFLHARSLF